MKFVDPVKYGVWYQTQFRNWGDKTFQRGQNTDKNKANFLGECKILLYHQKLCPEGT